jgi:hypothetical protein
MFRPYTWAVFRLSFLESVEVLWLGGGGGGTVPSSNKDNDINIRCNHPVFRNNRQKKPHQKKTSTTDNEQADDCPPHHHSTAWYIQGKNEISFRPLPTIALLQTPKRTTWRWPEYRAETCCCSVLYPAIKVITVVFWLIFHSYIKLYYTQRGCQYPQLFVLHTFVIISL